MSTEHIERKFEGWAALNENAVKGQLKWIEYEPKQFAEDDVERKSVTKHY
jgi:alcohol dehydrogenase (NADP+)